MMIKEKIQRKMGFAMKTRLNFQYIAGFCLVASFITFCSLKGDRISKREEELQKMRNINNGSSSSTDQESCNFFSGRWVYDEKSQTSYNATQCSFMLGEYSCEEFGRKDLKYQNWQWQPHHCHLPRFNGTALLEKLRGKKLVFVGDSLNRNMWISMLCLLEASVPLLSSKYIIRDRNFFFFQAIEHNATIGFYWSPFLVESNNDDPVNRHPDFVVRINSIEKHAIQWTDADILIFDSYAWWTQPEITLLWGQFGSPDAINKTVEMKLRRYEMALDTWSNWLEVHINRTRTKLFFMSLSPMHYQWGEDWSAHRNCYNETEPILRERYWGIGTDREMMQVAESAIKKLESRGVKVQYLNITQLSDYRKDAHPSIYKNFFHPPTEEQIKDPKSYADCAHWCLPGVPDTWNHILYSYLLMNS